MASTPPPPPPAQEPWARPPPAGPPQAVEDQLFEPENGDSAWGGAVKALPSKVFCERGWSSTGVVYHSLKP